MSCSDQDVSTGFFVASIMRIASPGVKWAIYHICLLRLTELSTNRKAHGIAHHHCYVGPHTNSFIYDSPFENNTLVSDSLFQSGHRTAGHKRHIHTYPRAHFRHEVSDVHLMMDKDRRFRSLIDPSLFVGSRQASVIAPAAQELITARSTRHIIYIVLITLKLQSDKCPRMQYTPFHQLLCASGP